MTQEEKELLLKDISARLLYEVKVQYNNEIYNIDYISALYEEVKLDIPVNYTIGISEIKPYLRPMSSMTEEEKEEYNKVMFQSERYENNYAADIDWLNAHHFDYHRLIEKGLALVAPDGMYEK